MDDDNIMPMGVDNVDKNAEAKRKRKKHRDCRLDIVVGPDKRFSKPTKTCARLSTSNNHITHNKRLRVSLKPNQKTQDCKTCNGSIHNDNDKDTDGDDDDDDKCNDQSSRQEKVATSEDGSDEKKKSLNTMTLDFWSYNDISKTLIGQVRYHRCIEDGRWITTKAREILSSTTTQTSERPNQDDVVITMSGSRYRLLRSSGQSVMTRIPNGYSVNVACNYGRIQKNTPYDVQLQWEIQQQENFCRRNDRQGKRDKQQQQSQISEGYVVYSVAPINNSGSQDHVNRQLVLSPLASPVICRRKETTATTNISTKALQPKRGAEGDKNSNSKSDDFFQYRFEKKKKTVQPSSNQPLAPTCEIEEEINENDHARRHCREDVQNHESQPLLRPPQNDHAATSIACSNKIFQDDRTRKTMRETYPFPFLDEAVVKYDGNQKQPPEPRPDVEETPIAAENGDTKVQSKSLRDQLVLPQNDAHRKNLTFLCQQQLATKPDTHDDYRPPCQVEMKMYESSQITDLSDDGKLLQQIIQNGENASQERSQQLSQPSLDSSEYKPEERNLEFGYFADGKSIFRNRLNKDEKLKEGFLSLSNMVLPESQHVIITTFSGSCATVQWLYEEFHEIPNVLVLSDCKYGGKDSAYINVSQRPGWRWIRAKPIGRGPRPVYHNKAGIPSFAERPKAASSSSAILQHSKILLFRSAEGLRIVVSGNNFTKRQYLQDRDCLWVQDIPVDSAQSSGRMSNNLQVKEMTTLRDFVTDLVLSGPIFGSDDDQDNDENSLDKKIEEETKLYIRRLACDLFDGLNDQQLNKQVRFVYSFPRRRSWKAATGRNKFERVGGWQQLAESVFSLRESIGLVKKNPNQSSPVEDGARKISRWSDHYDDYSVFETDDEEEEQQQQRGNAQRNQEDSVEPLSHGKMLEDSLHLYVMSGSFGNIVPNFIVNMRAAMVGHGAKLSERIITCRLPLSWSVIKKTYCLWPDIGLMKLMNPLGISGRGVPKVHWDSIPSAVRQQLFFNSVPNPDAPALRDLAGPQCEFSGYHSFAHGKVMFATTNAQMAKSGSSGREIMVDKTRDYATLYVGSHNFSKKAWGMNGTTPGNVEFGVVMITNDVQQASAWRSRLPYDLPKPGSKSSQDYMPGSAWLQAQRQLLLEQQQEGDGYETENEDYVYEDRVKLLSIYN